MFKVIVALALCAAGTAVKLPAALEEYSFEQFQKDFQKTYAAEEVRRRGSGSRVNFLLV
jgi:hypothetical protein